MNSSSNDILGNIFHSDDSSSSEDLLSSSSSSSSQRRDDVEQVRNMARNETRRVLVGRWVMNVVLLTTTVLVTLKTYRYLKNEQLQNCVTGFMHFSETILDAALEQQRDLLKAYAGMATAISASAQTARRVNDVGVTSDNETNSTLWPYYTLPSFEAYAKNSRSQSRSEMLLVCNIVRHDDRLKYIDWANLNHGEMLREGHLLGYGNLESLDPSGYVPYIYETTAQGPRRVPEPEHGHYCPAWSYSPPPSSYGLVNWDVLSIEEYSSTIEAALVLKNETLVSTVRPSANTNRPYPRSFVVHPIHKKVADYESEVVAIIGGMRAWDTIFSNLIPEGVEGLLAVLENTCNQSYTYEVNGGKSVLLGEGNLHEPDYPMGRTVDLSLHTHPNFTITPGHCHYKLKVYASYKFEMTYHSNTPEVAAIIIASTFMAILVVFNVFDYFVRRRNDKIVRKAAESNGVMMSVFPAGILDRLVSKEESKIREQEKSRSLALVNRNLRTLRSSSRALTGGKKASQKSLRTFMSKSGSQDEGSEASQEKPLADLFLETTVLFADITGFTAWSSVREPSHVFTLLETVFSAFDAIAKRRPIFKVETVGDCYVAVAGLPDPIPDHAVAMARFAQEILARMRVLTTNLESTLGPDTGDLSIRIGLHSGPVTGGVLRGARSRFQLFGDTMNTASRMESTGERGRIHVSQQTAELLDKHGKGSWLQRREHHVAAKGKGDMQTYWLRMRRKLQAGSLTGTSCRFSSRSFTGDDVRDLAAPSGLSAKSVRLVDWNVDVLQRLLKQIVVRRNATTSHKSVFKAEEPVDYSHDGRMADMPLEEVQEIITLPKFDSKAARLQEDHNKIELPSIVVEELRDYVTCVANLYQDNPFHNFDHCSHVVMSTVKLMSRIVAPAELATDDDNVDSIDNARQKKKVAMALHDHTYGITSDPLTQFACAFSALIHDVDHTGVPNTKVCEENPGLASIYKGRSVAEQNSLDLAWNLLFSERFHNLRGTIYSTQSELRRFRQLVVNSVMATDLGDKELKKLRNGRWDKAFRDDDDDDDNDDVTSNAISQERALSLPWSLSIGGSGNSSGNNECYKVNRKATIVIEHLIQASDVSHTMQHWHVYRKWNERLFKEMMNAYISGRADMDPSNFWYEGEISFFDYYIIPLAKKLKDCGVFGKSSDEYLNYALNNRMEWKQRGQQVIAEMKEKYNGKQR